MIRWAAMGSSSLSHVNVNARRGTFSFVLIGRQSLCHTEATKPKGRGTFIGSQRGATRCVIVQVNGRPDAILHWCTGTQYAAPQVRIACDTGHIHSRTGVDPTRDAHSMKQARRVPTVLLTSLRSFPQLVSLWRGPVALYGPAHSHEMRCFSVQVNGLLRRIQLTQRTSCVASTGTSSSLATPDASCATDDDAASIDLHDNEHNLLWQEATHAASSVAHRRSATHDTRFQRGKQSTTHPV